MANKTYHLEWSNKNKNLKNKLKESSELIRKKRYFPVYKNNIATIIFSEF